MERGSPSFWIKRRKERKKEVHDSILEKKIFFTLVGEGSNLSIGEVVGKPPPFSYLFCRNLLAGSCFNGSVTQKVQETTIGAAYGKCEARNLIGDTRELGYTQSQVMSHSPKLS